MAGAKSRADGLGRFALGKRGFRFGITLSVILLLMIGPFAVLATIAYQDQGDVARERAFEEVAAAASLEAARQEATIVSASQLVTALAEVPTLVSGGAGCTQTLASIHADFPIYSNVYVVGPEGVLLYDGVLPCSAIPTTAVASGRDFFEGAKATGNLTVGTYSISRATGLPIVVVGYPFANGSTFAGVVAAAIDLGSLAEGLERTGNATDALLFVTDSNGTIMAGSERADEFVGRSAPIRTEMLGNDEGLVVASGLDNVSSFYAFHAVHDPSGKRVAYVAVGLATDDVLGPIDAAFRTKMLVFAAIAGGGLALTWVVAAATLGRNDRALRLSEAGLREAQRMAHIGSWELDLVKNALWWSDETYRIFGVEPGAFGATYESFLDTIHPDDREAVNTAYTASLATGAPYDIEHRRVMQDGSVKWLHARCETSYGSDGQPLKSVGTVQDITDMKRAQAAELAQKSAQADYRKLFENMAEGLAHCRVYFEDDKPVDFEYLRVNAQFDALTGLHDVIGKRVSHVIPGFRETDAELLALYGRVAHGGPPERKEVHVPGLARWFSITAYAAGPDEFVAVFDNVTERKTVEERLRLKARLLASVGQAVIATDTSGIITYWGAGAVALYGWTAEEVLGRPIVEVTPSQTSRAQAEEIMTRLAAGKSWSGECVVSRKDGSSFTALVNDNPLLDDGGHLVGVIGVSQDISAMKAALGRVSFQAHLLESVSQAVASTDLEGRVTYWNPAAEKLFGWSNAEAVGRPVVDLWGDIQVLSPHQDANEAAPTGDYPMRRKDGSSVLVNLGTSPLLSPAGALEGFIAVGQDATEARAQTIALRRRERALTLISAVNNELIRADSEAGLLEAICDIAVAKGGYQMAWVGIARDTPGHPVEPVAWAGHEAGYIKDIRATWDNVPRGQVTGKSIRERRTIVIRDLAHNPAFAPWRDQALANGYASAIALFLPLGDERGAMVMYAAQPDAFTADEVTLLEEMAGDLAFGLRTLRMRAKESAITIMLNDAEKLSKMGSWEYNAATRKVTWSREVYRIHEVPESYDPGDAARDIQFYEGGDVARVDAAFRAAVERGKPYDLEVALMTAKGRRRDVRLIGMPEMKDRKVVRVQGNIMDITESKEAARRLEQETQLLERAEAVAKVGSWALDLRTGTGEWSKENYRLMDTDLGTPPTFELFLSRVHPNDRARIQEELGGAFADPRAERYEADYKVLLRNGETRIHHDRARITRDENGKPVAAAGSSQDVTEQREADHHLKRQTALLQRAEAIAQLGSWTMDLVSGAMEWSKEKCRLLDLEPGTPPTRELFLSRVHPDDREAPLARLGAALANPEVTRFEDEYRVILRDGEVRIHRDDALITRDETGKPVALVGTSQDVTERKQAEAARETMAAKDREVTRLQDMNKMRMDFLNTAAHDLKTPLTPLKLQVAIMRRASNLDPAQKEGLDRMDRNILRFQLLVDDMLDAARLQSGRVKLNRKNVDLAPLVTEAIAAFEEPAKVAGVSLQAVQLPVVMVDVDPAKAMQVLMNVVSNAVKYTSAGGHVAVRVTVTPDEAILAVTDTGLGMTPDQLGRLFQSFVRLHEDQPHVAKGTGLGLYISKGLVEQHGGRMWAESDGPGKGSTFFVAWPLAKTVPATPAAAKGKVNEPAA
ncbi:MAG: PAS domain-containing protein [Candidatus Thermoplasmatota archaeon]